MVSARERLEIEVLARDFASKILKRVGDTATTQGQRAEKGMTLGARGAEAFRGALQRATGQMAAFVAATLTLRRAVQSGRDFSLAIAEVSTIVDDAVFPISKIREEVLALADAHGVAATEVAKGLYQTISAGASDAAEAIRILDQAQRLAIAGLTTTETAVDGLTNVLNAYGLESEEAGRISDVFFETVRLGKTRVDELSGSVGSVTPIAAELGVRFEAVAAAIATMTKQGISTSEAVTRLRGILIAFLKKTEEVDTALRRVGGSFDLNTLRTEGLGSTLNLLRKAFEGNESALTQLLGRAEATTGVFALTGKNAETLSETMDALTNSAGSTDKALEKINESSGRRLVRLFGEVGNALTTAGERFLDFAFGVADSVSDAFAGIEDAARGVGDALGFNPKLTEEQEKLLAAAGATREEFRAFSADAVEFVRVSGLAAKEVRSLSDELKALGGGLALLGERPAISINITAEDFDEEAARRSIGDTVIALPVEFDPEDLAGLRTDLIEQVDRFIDAGLIRVDDLGSALSTAMEVSGKTLETTLEDGTRVVVDGFVTKFSDGVQQLAPIVRRLGPVAEDAGEGVVEGARKAFLQLTTEGPRIFEGAAKQADLINRRTIELLDHNARLSILAGQLGSEYERQRRAVEAQTLAAQARIAKEIASGDISEEKLRSLKAELSLLERVRDARLEELRAQRLAARPVDLGEPRGLADLITGLAGIAARAAPAANEMQRLREESELLASVLDEVAAFTAQTASAFDQERAKIRESRDALLAKISAEVTSGRLAVENAANEQAAIRETAAALLEQVNLRELDAKAAERARELTEAHRAEALALRASTDLLRLKGEAEGDTLALAILAVEDKVRAIQEEIDAALKAGAISADRHAKELADLAEVREALLLRAKADADAARAAQKTAEETRKQAEAARRLREIYEGDDFAAAFSARLGELTERFTSLGQLGVDFADLTARTFEDFGRAAAEGGEAMERFKQKVVADIAAILARAAGLLILREVFGVGADSGGAGRELQKGGAALTVAGALLQPVSKELVTAGGLLLAAAIAFKAAGVPGFEHGGVADRPLLGTARLPGFEHGGMAAGKLLGTIPLGGRRLSARAYAEGGIADDPTLAVFGEGSARRHGEAFVPLGPGRRIPVEMRGPGPSAGSGQPVTVNISVNALDARSAADVFSQPGVQQAVTDAVSNGIRLGTSRDLVTAIREVR